MGPRTAFLCVVLCVFASCSATAQNYPDQHFVVRIDSLIENIETVDGLSISGDSSSMMLQPDRTHGTVVFKPQSAPSPFNQGLPSWNGSAPDANSSFKVEMRFPWGTGWSPWLTVGYWKGYIWSSYGTTSYAGGYVDIDYVKLNSYVSAWQFRVTMDRTGVGQSSPTLHKLSFFVSDSRTTTSQDFSQILNDRPEEIFVATDFIYQYGVDPDIGGSICSPASVSMILRSYGIPVDPLEFARDTQDPHFDIFGVWPRVVQNASEYGLDGAVTRYRSWSQAREVLANGGRISMSVGLPLYAGHLIMLAGFTAGGDPLVHDPARADGYAYEFEKSDLSHSWFDKGGIGYTFYPAGTDPVSVERSPAEGVAAGGFELHQNYPNPFNPSTTIRYTLPLRSHVTLTIFNTLGEKVGEIHNGEADAGNHEARFDAGDLASGVYLYRLQVRPLNVLPSGTSPTGGSAQNGAVMGRDPMSGAGEFVLTRGLLLLR